MSIKNICVIGMPGSGKSWVAEHLSQDTEFNQVIFDSDTLVSKVFPNSNTSFRHFCLYEKAVYKWVKSLEYLHLLIAGGSSPMRESWLFSEYDVYWLNPSLQVCYGQFQRKLRVGLDRQMTYEEYEALYEERKNIYSKAHYVTENSEQLVKLIYKNYYQNVGNT